MRSQDTIAPHFSSPFRFSAAGTHVEVDEQGSPDEIRGCVYNILVTPIGHREELPEFGVADPTFRLMGASLEDVQAAVEQWEDRAPVLLDEDPDFIEQAIRRVRVLVG